MLHWLIFMIHDSQTRHLLTRMD
uniref:Uncharacterized protein n=1 Tax=Lepeophtheirus salmonis TaxID=72036 RepID=A0A0K2VCU1_LEPSM